MPHARKGSRTLPPPDPAVVDAGWSGEVAAAFLSAEDFDLTGVLPGVDLRASSYWWQPESFETDAPAGPLPWPQAAAPGSRRTAAA